MKRYLFTRELFRSRFVALTHASMFLYMLGLAILNRETVVAGTTVMFGALALFWICVSGYNIYARHKEFRFKWGAAKQLLRAQQSADSGEPTEAQGSLGFCWDCITEGEQKEATFAVTRGPNGEKVPVCLKHARAQAQQNAADAEKKKEVAL